LADQEGSRDRSRQNWIEDRYNRLRRHASIDQIGAVAFELQYSCQIADSQKAA